MKRIGIFSGTFDPVHKGHIGFALQAIQEALLDEVHFLPERKPRRKTGITHYAHRVGMLRAALKPYPKLKIMELTAATFSPANTLPVLNKHYENDQIFLLLGSDIIYGLSKWPRLELLLNRCGLILALRGADQKKTIVEKLQALPVQPLESFIFTSKSPNVSSAEIRNALTHHQKADGLLTSVQKYSKQHWLYHQVRPAEN